MPLLRPLGCSRTLLLHWLANSKHTRQRPPTPHPSPPAHTHIHLTPPHPFPPCPQITDDLKNFLTTNLPKVKKEGKAKFKLGVSEPKLGSAIQVSPAAVRTLAAGAGAAGCSGGGAAARGARGAFMWGGRRRGGGLGWLGRACCGPPADPLRCADGNFDHSFLLILGAQQEETGVPCECNEYVGELLRGVRQHLATFIKVCAGE